MHECNHFILGNRRLRWYNTITMHHAALVHTLCLAEKETRKRTKINSQNTASSSKLYYLLEYMFFFYEPADKKNKKWGGKTGEEAATLVPGIRITSRTLWTTTNKLEAGPGAKGRDNEGQMRRSHVCFFGLVATCDVPGTCPTPKLPLFLNPIQMRPQKCGRLDVCKSGVCGAGLNRNMEWGVGVCTYVERDCRKEVHTVVVLSNSKGQTAGGTRERQQRRALETTPEGGGRGGVTKKADKL